MVKNNGSSNAPEVILDQIRCHRVLDRWRTTSSSNEVATHPTSMCKTKVGPYIYIYIYREREREREREVNLFSTSTNIEADLFH